MTDIAGRLWSIHEIQQLAYRYAEAHDTRDLAALDAIFVPAEEPLGFPSFNRADLRAAIPEYFKVAGPTILFVANHRIDLVGDSHATGNVYCFAKISIAGSWIEQAIMYQDTYERYEGAWRIATRRHLLWYGIDLPERPLDQPKTQWPAGATGRSLPEDFATWRDFYGIAEAPTGFYATPQSNTTFG